MRRKLLPIVSSIAIGMVVFACGRNAEAPKITETADTVKQVMQVADPFVLKVDDVYYLYGTNDLGADKGIPVYRSKDLREWEGPVGLAGDGLALSKGQSFGTAGFWAPYVLHAKGRFYMYYTANERIAVATSDSPLGPFTQQELKPLHADVKEIDPHVYIDDNGKAYLYFVRLINGNRIFGAAMNEDLVSIDENTVVPCISQSQDWEIVSGAQWPVTEAPSMIRHNGVYYLFYTANDFRSPAYNVGYATADSPLGPWKKNDGNPIIPKTDGVPGTGGSEFIKGPTSELLIFYHSHYSGERVAPRKIVYSQCSFTPEGKMKVDENKIFPKVEP